MEYKTHIEPGVLRTLNINKNVFELVVEKDKYNNSFVILRDTNNILDDIQLEWSTHILKIDISSKWMGICSVLNPWNRISEYKLIDLEKCVKNYHNENDDLNWFRYISCVTGGYLIGVDILKNIKLDLENGRIEMNLDKYFFLSN